MKFYKIKFVVTLSLIVLKKKIYIQKIDSEQIGELQKANLGHGCNLYAQMECLFKILLLNRP